MNPEINIEPAKAEGESEEIERLPLALRNELQGKIAKRSGADDPAAWLSEHSPDFVEAVDKGEHAAEIRTMIEEWQNAEDEDKKEREEDLLERIEELMMGEDKAEKEA